MLLVIVRDGTGFEGGGRGVALALACLVWLGVVFYGWRGMGWGGIDGETVALFKQAWRCGICCCLG